MTKTRINKKIKKLIEERVLGFATSDKKGKPNVVAVAGLKVYDNNKVLITDNFFKKTRDNLLENNNVALVVWDIEEKYGFQLKGKSKYLTNGKWKKIVDEMRENEGFAHKGAVLVKVDEIYKL